MSLIKREPSPAQSRASQENGRHSHGPRSERGKATSSRNLPQHPRPFSEVVARSMEALGERPADFEQINQALAEALEPRDGWEAAWVQDIAILRWRLERLQRAEVGVLALRRRKLQNQRVRAAATPTGSAALELNSLAGLCGFTRLPDSAMKFQQVIAVFTLLCNTAKVELFEDNDSMFFKLLYGGAMGPHGAVLKSHYESVAKKYKEEGDSEAAAEARRLLIDELSKEIAHWEQLQSLYAAEHLEADPLQEDAELLLPSQELDEIIRYETHLEDQIERKLRQFYARRREPVLPHAEILPPAVEETPASELACQAASVEA